MKRFLLLLALATATAATNAQTLRLGTAYHRTQQQKARSLRTAQQPKMQMQTQPTTAAAQNAIIDETTDVRGDNMYRYVFAYNSNHERSSETIYKKTRTTEGWSDEELCNKGFYTYEYDSQGRIVSKTVKYEKDYTEFTSYNIGVTYCDGYTQYSRSSIDSEGNYTAEAEWSFYDNGQLRSYATIDSYYPGNNTFILYDENGSCIETSLGEGSEYSLTKRTLHGTLNDSTITTYNYNYNGPERVDRYVYDPSNGKLKEFRTWGKYTDSYRYEYIYDSLGRISAIKKYYEEDDEAVIAPTPETTISTATTTEAIAEPAWRLEYNETFTYFNDEVYGLGNTWHDVLGMDGPLLNHRIVDDDYEEASPYVEDLTFNRDADGKLLSVVSTRTEIPGIIEQSTIEVDDNGHITQEHYYFKDSWTNTDLNTEEWYVDDVTINFNWETADGIDYISTAEQTDIYKSRGGDNSTNKYSFMYMYSPDTQFIVQRSLNGGNTYYAEVRRANKGIKISERDNRFIQEVQTEDVRFVRPNLLKDYDGFTPDSTIIASVKDRVVVYKKMRGTSYDPAYRWADFEWLGGDIEAYFNTNDETYFSISHDGDLTICKNIDNLPVYVLQDGRLLKEYIYEDIAYNTGSAEPSPETKSVTVPAGNAYTEITYAYNTQGLVVGQTVKRTDEKGTVTDEVTVEVKYDPVSGIEQLEASTGGTLLLSGRTLGLSTGGMFSVFTTEGKLLSSPTTSFHFPAPGIYLVSANGKTTKLSIK